MADPSPVAASRIAVALLISCAALPAGAEPSGSSAGDPAKLEVRASVEADNPSRDGTFQLEWGDATASEVRYRVELAAPPDADTYELWYEGTARQSFVSGMPSGTVRVRVRRLTTSTAADGAASWGPWTEPLQIPVEHHAMSKALVLLVVGALVFGSVLVFVVQGALRYGREEAGS